MSAAGRPLVGVDDLATPQWAAVDRQVAETGLWRTLVALPSGIRTVVGLSWRTSRVLTLLNGILAIAGGAVTAVGLVGATNVLTVLLAGGPTPQRILAALPAILLVVAAFSARALLESASAGAEAMLKPRVEQAARDDAHDAIARVELISFEDSEYAELVRQGLQRGMRSIEGCIEAITAISGSLVNLVAALLTMAVLNPLLAPLVLFSVLPTVWASARAAKLSYESYLQLLSRVKRMALASELITERETAGELRACTAGPALVAEYRRISTNLTHETSRLELSKARVRLVGRTVAGVGTGVAYLLLVLMLHANIVPLALAGAAVLAMRLAATALSTTMHGVNMLYENILYLDVYTSLMVETKRRIRVSSTLPAPVDPAVIALKDVSFTYPGQREPAVRDLDLTVHKGQTIALVGENGSGKTTLAKLVTGLYLATGGKVSWDGVDLADADEHSIHDQITLVMQEPARWPMTADDNIRIGRLDRHDPDGSALRDAADDSGAAAVIEDLPSRGATVLSRRFVHGQDLSGGQWQRISVARGLYRDSPILVADEPTAAMDARAEHAVFQSLQRLRESSGTARTTILITHRLANVRHADQIVVLDHGTIVEQGTHDELMARRGTYAELFDLQAAAYQTQAAV